MTLLHESLLRPERGFVRWPHGFWGVKLLLIAAASGDSEAPDLRCKARTAVVHTVLVSHVSHMQVMLLLPATLKQSEDTVSCAFVILK